MSFGHGTYGGNAIAKEAVASTFIQVPPGTGVNVFVGTFDLPNTTAIFPITGVGFIPKAVFFWGEHNTTVGGGNELERTFGVATGTVASGQQWHTCSVHNVLNNYTSHKFHDQGCIEFLYGPASGGAIAYAHLDSFTSDGFNLAVEFNNPTEVRKIYFMAIGGPSVSIKAGAFNSNAVTGNQAITGVGFSPKATIFASGEKSTAMNGATDVRSNIGWATSSTAQYANAMRAVAGASSSVHSLALTTACLMMMTASAADEKASFVSNDADGFTINWVTKSATAFRVGYICMGGAAQYAVGTLTEPGAAGSAVATAALSFQPVVEMYATQGAAASTAVQTGARNGVGVSATATNGVAIGSWTANASSSATVPATTISTALSLLTNGATNGAVSNKAVLLTHNSNGFTLNWTAVDANTVQYAFLAIGAGVASSQNKTITATAANSTKFKKRSVNMTRKIASPMVLKLVKVIRTKKAIASATIKKLLKQSAVVSGTTLKVVGINATSMVRSIKPKSKAQAASTVRAAKTIMRTAPISAVASSLVKIIKSFNGIGPGTTGKTLTASSASISTNKRKPQKAILLTSQGVTYLRRTPLSRLAVASSSIVALVRSIGAKRKATAADSASLGKSRLRNLVVVASNSPNLKKTFRLTKQTQSLSQSTTQRPRLLYKQSTGVSSVLPFVVRKASSTRKATASSVATVIKFLARVRSLASTSNSAASVGRLRVNVRALLATSSSSVKVVKVIKVVRLAFSSNSLNIIKYVSKLRTGSTLASASVKRIEGKFARATASASAAISKSRLTTKVITAIVASASARYLSHLLRVASATVSVATIKNKSIISRLQATTLAATRAARKVSRSIMATATQAAKITFGHTQAIKAASATVAKAIRTMAMKRATTASNIASAITGKFRVVVLSASSFAAGLVNRIFTSGGLPVANAQHTLKLRRRIRKIIIRLRNRA